MARILIVDDSTSQLAAMKKIVDKLGHEGIPTHLSEVSESANLHEARHLLEFRFDLG